MGDTIARGAAGGGVSAESVATLRGVQDTSSDVQKRALSEDADSEDIDVMYKSLCKS